jgi:hypothetical protein
MKVTEREAVRTVGFLLARKEARCQRVLARTRAGVNVNPGDAQACAWCLWGAILLVAARLHIRRERLYLLVARVLGLVERRGEFNAEAHLYEEWDSFSESQADACVRLLQVAA